MKKVIKLLLIAVVLSIGYVVAANHHVGASAGAYRANQSTALPVNKVAIIFGAGINQNRPGKYLQDRLDAGIRLYHQKKVQKLLLSGDNGHDTHDELTVMKLYCAEKGVDTNHIYIDYAGFDTYSTLYRAKHVFGVDHAILVSQAYHLERAVYIGNRLGLTSFGYAADHGLYKGYGYVKFREYLAVSKAVLDVSRNRKPHFLGTPVPINGPSNYTKQ